MKIQAYQKFFLMLLCSFLTMYAVMYLNVFEFDHVYFNLTRVYMSLLMVTPMAILMILMMPSMYKDRKKNIVIILTGIIIFIISLIFLRKQILIADEQYMLAMIPHHSSAILTSMNADIKDPEVKILTEEIIKTQEKEIALMKEILNRMKKIN